MALAALGIKNPPINALGAFQEGAQNQMAANRFNRQEAEAALDTIGSIALGVMGGDMNGKPNPQRWEQALDMLEQNGMDVKQYRGRSDLAPIIARGSLDTMQQIQVAQNEQQMELAMKRLDETLRQNAIGNAMDRERLDFQKAQASIPKAPDLETIYDEGGSEYKAYYDTGNPNADANGYVKVGGSKAQRDGIVIGPDGEVRIGGPSQGKFDDQTAKNEANVIDTARQAATQAQELNSLANQMETVLPNVGRTGPGGEVLGRVDDVIGILEGDSGARGAFKQMSMDSQLAMTEKTKGAITDREMGMFKQAVPGMTQTNEANKAMIEVMRAAAKRQSARASFLEQYRNRTGSLNGANEAWQNFIDQNEILTLDNQGNLKVNSKNVSGYERYLPDYPRDGEWTIIDGVKVKKVSD